MDMNTQHLEYLVFGDIPTLAKLYFLFLISVKTIEYLLRNYLTFCVPTGYI
jgi:hypothetical protein